MFLMEKEDCLDNLAIADEYGVRFTYRNLEDLSEMYGEMVPSRSLVLILCDSSIDTVAFYYCMMNNAAVPIMLGNHLDREFIENLVRAYQPEYLWAKAGAGALPEGWNEVYVRNDHALIKTKYTKANLYEELALLLATSGSTGSPKFVRLGRANIICNSEAMAECVNLQSDDRGISILPYNFCYCLSSIHMHWHVGAAFYITEKIMVQKEFWDFFEKSGITNFEAVPYQYQILERIGFTDKNYPFFRFSTCAGAPLTDEMCLLIQNNWGRKGIRFYPSYGQTEGSGLLAAVPSERVQDKIGSIGVACKGLKAYIDDSSNGEGELIFEGTSVGLGYAFSREDLIKGDENNGVLYTGDIAYMDEEGFIFLKGRLKRFIKLLGIRYSLDEMEKVINARYGEGEVVCTGVDDQVIVYCTGGYETDEIRDYCIKKFGIKGGMIQVKWCEAIPRNESGKILYSALM